MKLKVFLFTLFLAAAQAVMAQVSVNVTLDQDIYLSGESVIATVEITNLTGQSLKLGTQPNWLEFHIESKSETKPYVNRLGEMDMSGEFNLGASMSAKRSIDILPYFDERNVQKTSLSTYSVFPFNVRYCCGVQFTRN